MLKLFSETPRVVGHSDIQKRYSHNGVLSYAFLDPTNFHANLLMGLSLNGRIQNMSYAYFKESNNIADEVMFTLHVIDEFESKIHITFNFKNIYYCETLTVKQELLDTFNQHAIELYVAIDKLKGKAPRSVELLRNIFKSAMDHMDRIIVDPRREYIQDDIPVFIETLGQNFVQEAADCLVEYTADQLHP